MEGETERQGERQEGDQAEVLVNGRHHLLI